MSSNIISDQFLSHENADTYNKTVGLSSSGEKFKSVLSEASRTNQKPRVISGKQQEEKKPQSDLIPAKQKKEDPKEETSTEKTNLEEHILVNSQDTDVQNQAGETIIPVVVPIVLIDTEIAIEGDSSNFSSSVNMILNSDISIQKQNDQKAVLTILNETEGLEVNVSSFDDLPIESKASPETKVVNGVNVVNIANSIALETIVQETLGGNNVVIDAQLQNLNQQGFVQLPNITSNTQDATKALILQISPTKPILQLSENDKLNLEQLISLDKEKIQTDIIMAAAKNPANIPIINEDEKESKAFLGNLSDDETETSLSEVSNIALKETEYQTKGQVTFTTIKLQDITKKLPSNQSIVTDSNFKPLITQNGDQLLVSYKEIQEQPSIKVSHTEQVFVSVRHAAAYGKNHVLLSMYPEALGVVDIKIEFNDAKEISSIKIFVEKHETLQLLKMDSENLRDSLKIIIKSEDASLSFNLRDGQNEGSYEEPKKNDQANNIQNIDKEIIAGEDMQKKSLTVYKTTDIDITV